MARIQGSGPHGRIVARDVAAAKSGQGLRAPAAAPSPAPAIAPSMSDQQILALYEAGSYQIIPHDGMRRTIAQRLTASVQTIPHFYLTLDCNIGKLLEAREEINAAAPKAEDGKPAWKLSVNDFVIKALALALQRVPEANVTWTEAGMLKHVHSDIGVAVAMPGGLITPIVRNAEANLKDAEQAVNAEKKQIQSLNAEKKKALEALLAERQRMIAPIDESMRDLYERIAKRHHGTALAEARDEQCRGCGLRVLPHILQLLRQDTNEDLFRCESCGLILYSLEPIPVANPDGASGDAASSASSSS